MDTRLPLSYLRLPTTVKVAISTSSCPSDKKDCFKKECISFIIGAINKLKERLPIKSLIVGGSLCLSPGHILNKKFSVPTFEQLADKIFKLKYISSVEADAAKLEFPSFIIHVQKSCVRNLVSSTNSMIVWTYFLGSSFFQRKMSSRIFGKCVFLYLSYHMVKAKSNRDSTSTKTHSKRIFRRNLL